MKNKLLLPIFLCMGVLFVSSLSFAQGEQQDILGGFVQEALEHNPRIQAALNRWEAAQYAIGRVQGLPDPVASYGYFGENVQTKTGPQEQKFGFSQKIPFPGKLNLKGKAQGKQAQILKEQYEGTRREVIKEVKLTFYDLYWIDQAIRVTDEEKGILENLERVSRRKYETNLANQQDVIKAQVELSKLVDKLYLLKQNRQSLQAKMKSLLNRTENLSLENISQIKERDYSYTLDTLMAWAEETRPELLSANLATEKAQFEKSLARMDYLPDFTFGVEYIDIGGGTTALADDGQDAWMGMVSVNIPLWFGRLNTQLNEKKADLRAAQNYADNVKNSVTYEVQDIHFKILAYQDIVTLYETTLIPQAQQAFDGAKTGYERGRIDFLNWLDAQRTLLQTWLAYYKAVADYHKSIAFLERIVGRDL
ncbi:MAG: TolC family protein [Candidatus Omnitrophota bacterium]